MPSARRPGPEATDARLVEAVGLIEGGSVSVLSLDVFDTLLWRKVAEPMFAFGLLGARLHDAGVLARDLDIGGFAELRSRAETAAREARDASGRGVEVTLREIYERLPSEIVREITLDDLATREVDFERSILVPDLDIVELARLAAERGVRVVCVSDTYFSEADLRSFVGAGPAGALDIERVFASSAHRVGKGSGLWRVVLDELGVAPKRVLHVGDNHHADVVAAKQAGVRPVYFERRPAGLAEIIRREDLHASAPLSPYHGDYGTAALRSKVLHRVEAAEQPPELRSFWEFGASGLGAPLTGFAEWVQERAGELGVSTAFCMMREGQLLSKLVNAAAAGAANPVAAQPIWLSRQVCARASIVEGSAEELSDLFQRRRMPTVGEYCSTLGIDPAEVEGFGQLAEARLGEPDLARELVERLAFDPALRARIVARSAELRSRLVRYLERLRPPGENRIVLVDLGWAATIQSLLDRILHEAGSDLKTTGLYLITTDRAADRMLGGADARGFLASAGHPVRPVQAFMRSPEILEQICMPDHGSQIDLDADLEPVLDTAESLPMQSAQREAVQKGIAAFQREWLRYRTLAPGALVPFHEYGQDRLRSILVRAITAPTPSEAALYAGWLHDENFGSTGLEPLVSPTAAKAARYLEPDVLLKSSMAELYWPFGLAALHDEHLARAVEATASGLISGDGFASALETGPVEIYCDRGWGFRRSGMAVVRARRNRSGLSYANGTLVGDLIRRVRIDLAKAPCVIRVDWIRLRCLRRGGLEPVTLDFDTSEQLAGITAHGMRPIGRGTYLVMGGDPNLILDLRKLVEDDVHTVSVECGFAVLSLPPVGIQRRVADLKARLREQAKRGRLAGPARIAFALMRKLD
jgi:FMN phosphatase YigB (HAD superfamily)